MPFCSNILLLILKMFIELSLKRTGICLVRMTYYFVTCNNCFFKKWYISSAANSRLSFICMWLNAVGFTSMHTYLVGLCIWWLVVNLLDIRCITVFLNKHVFCTALQIATILYLWETKGAYGMHIRVQIWRKSLSGIHSSLATQAKRQIINYSGGLLLALPMFSLQMKCHNGLSIWL